MLCPDPNFRSTDPDSCRIRISAALILIVDHTLVCYSVNQHATLILYSTIYTTAADSDLFSGVDQKCYKKKKKSNKLNFLKNLDFFNIPNKIVNKTKQSEYKV